MTARRASSTLGRLAALLAVAFLLLAGVRSTVMQVEMAAAPAGAMPGCVDMGHGRRGASKPQVPGKTCEFCAVAGHLPVCSGVAALHPPVAVAWTAQRPLASLGPRGPPAVSPRARGPPPAFLTS